MRLQLDFVDIKDIKFGAKTCIENNVLFINKEEAEALVLEDEKIASATVELAFPGENTRIVNIQDVVEPRCKVIPEGTDFPGWISPIKSVGEGETRVLRGMALVLCNNDSDRAFHSFLDMSGRISKVSVFAKMPLVVLTAWGKNKDFNYREYDFAIHRAQFRLAVYLAKAGVPVKADATTIYEHDFANLPKDSNLPRVGYFFQLYTPQYDHLGLPEPILYGTECSQILPTLMNPNEILDGGLVCYFPCKGLTTYFLQNHGMITELYSRHMKDFIFCGMIVAVAHMNAEQRDRRAMISARLAKDILNADGLVMTKVHGGMTHMDLATAAEACERLGIRTIPVHQGLGISGTLSDQVLFKSDLLPGVVYFGITAERVLSHAPQPTRFLGGTGETVLYSPDHVLMQAKDAVVQGEEFLIPGVIDFTGSRPIVTYDY